MRRSPALTVWLGILAMLAQLWLPSVHAAAYADRSGDPLAYAMCGSGMSSLASQLRESLPAEIVQALDAQHAVPDLPDCHACVGAHAPTAGGASAPTIEAPVGTPTFGTHTRVIILASHDAWPPPARGPPSPV